MCRWLQLSNPYLHRQLVYKSCHFSNLGKELGSEQNLLRQYYPPPYRGLEDEDESDRPRGSSTQTQAEQASAAGHFVSDFLRPADHAGRPAGADHSLSA